MNHTKKEYIIYRVNRSLETFDDAKILFRERRWNSCMNRLYYSTFYSVITLLLSVDIEAKTHNGVRRMFSKEFIKTGKIDKEYGKLYSNLFGSRNEGDYNAFIVFDEKMVLPLVTETEKFIEQIKSKINYHEKA
jgi:uncharacterized protein (UPF0332 family)